jgi:hypothetical protein
MTRKIRKSGSKQGIILVMVLMILAMAMIFISAALLLTNSTRSRLYTNAEQSQARLTVTAASELFYNALETQEINDATLSGLATAGSTITMSSEASGTTTGGPSLIPGMGTDPDNCTKVHIYSHTDPGTGKKYIYLDFTTTIDQETENVRMILREPTPTPNVSAFSVPVKIAHATSASVANLNIGAGAPGSAKDNYVIIQGDGTTVDLRRSDSGKGFDSTFIFVGKTATTGCNVNFNTDYYHGDLVFVGDYAKMDLASNAHPYCYGNIIFIGSSGSTSHALTSQPSLSVDLFDTSKTYNRNWWFINRVADNGDLEGNKFRNALTWAQSNGQVGSYTSTNGAISSTNWSDSQLVNMNSSSWTHGSPDTTLAANISKYFNADYTGHNDLPDTDTAFASFGVSKEHPSSGLTTDTSMTGEAFVNKYNYATYHNVLPAKTYYLSGGHTDINSNPDTPKYIFLDGSKDYKIYIGSSYNIKGVAFIVLGPIQTQPKVYFILENGVNIDAGYTNNSKGNSTDWLATGFISVTLKGYTASNVDTCFNDIKDGGKKAWDLLDLKRDDSNGNVMQYGTGSAYDGVTRPNMYILGAGDNDFTLGDTGGGGAFCEAYVGLYNETYDKTDANTSRFIWNHNVNYVYARIEAQVVQACSNTNGACIPYCAGIDGNEDHSPRPAGTQYEIEDIIYYYN